ncbi:MAG: hypothetical protein BGO49_27200 [Planctomycetales bacterium 71-10]|nr:MAG: hypothetical protein BGO49_27200 [Planctomycetales bacterium 71-10]
MFGFGNFGGDGGADDGGAKVKGWEDYHKEVLRGLPDGERERMADAYECLRYSQGHFDDVEAMRAGRGGKFVNTSERFDGITPSGSNVEYEKADFSLGAPVMKRVCGELTKHLYKRPPTRELADKGVSAVLNDLYRRQSMAGKFQQADHYCTVGGFAGFSFAGLEDPKNPIKVHLWGADQLCVWPDPEDHDQVKAVATVERRDGRTLATLWTEDTISEYRTKRTEHPGTSSARRFELVSKRDNPYRLPSTADQPDQGRGIIPFSFCHFTEPTTEFTTDSPGDNLKELNRYVNWGLDDLADGVRYLTKPIGIAEGVAEDWSAPAVIRPGMFLNMSAGQVDAGGNGPAPKLGYLTADNSFVAVIWSHLNNYLDLCLEMHNVPPSTVRMILEARSGVSILSEREPLLAWTEARRRPWAHYELCAAVKFLEVLAAHVRNHGHDSRKIDAAALDPGLSLLWPRLYVDLPGPERDRADGVRIQWGYASLIDIVQEREDCTREQALSKLKRVKADNDELTGLGIEPVPAALQPNGGGGGGGFGGGPPQLNGPGVGDQGDQLDQVAAQGVGRGSGINGEPVDANGQADAVGGEG